LNRLKTSWPWLLAVALLLIFSTNVRAELLAGAARVEITPTLGEFRVPLAGYWNRLAIPAKGEIDPLHCRALVVDDGNETAAVISCDLVTISAALREKVVEGLDGTGLDDENILLAATHTHSGPGAYDKNLIFQAVLFGTYNDKFVEWLAVRIVDAVNQADENKRPAIMRVARTTIPGAVLNRRAPGGYDYVSRRTTGESGEGFTDPTLTAVRFDDETGAPIAALVHFAAHATILGADNMSFSADWPGAAMGRIEDGLPGAVAIYLNGAEGDQTPIVPDDDVDDVTHMFSFGERVGDAALAALNKAEPMAGAPVASALVRRKVHGPGRIMGLSLTSAMRRALFPALTLQVVRIGELALLAIPLEMTAAPGAALRESARFGGIETPLVVGLANDFYWYCVGPDEFEAGGYEVGNTILGRIEAGLVIGEQLMLIRQVTLEGG